MTISSPAKSRASVSAVFFANGLVIGSWAVLIPIVIANLAITVSKMGLIILLGGISAIIALSLSSRLISLFGARTVIILASVALTPGLFMMQWVRSPVSASIFVSMIMASLAFQDVAMNANAADIEQRAKRKIMSSFHGFWSAGTMTGAISGGYLIAIFGSTLFSIAIGIIALGIALFGYPHLEPKTPILAGENDTSVPVPKYFPAQWIPWLFGAIAFAGFVSEGAIIDWSAQYLREELASGLKLSGLAFGGFSLSMMLARFAGDSLREKVGDKSLFIASILLAGTGLLLAITAQTPVWAAAGFFVAGFGNANIVPIAFSAAATIKNLPKGMGIATASFCGYTGLLVAPACLGYLGEYAGFRMVYALMAGMLLLLLALAPMVGKQQDANN